MTHALPQAALSNRAWSELTLLALIWGGSFFSIALALREMGWATSVAHRVFWAALALWIVAWLRGLAVPRDLRIWGAFLVMGVLNNILPFSLMAWAQQEIETGLVSILNASTAIFGALAAATFLADERLTVRRGLGVATGFAGVVLIVGPAALGGLNLTSLAQIAVVGGTISYALAAVWAKLRLRGLAPEVAAAGMLTGSSLLAVPGAIWLDGWPRMLSLTGTLAVGYYALIATAGAYLLYYRVLALAGSANLMLVTLMIPPVAITLGALFLGETLPPRAFFGLAVIATGLAILDGRLLRRG